MGWNHQPDEFDKQFEGFKITCAGWRWDGIFFNPPVQEIHDSHGSFHLFNLPKNIGDDISF